MKLIVLCTNWAFKQVNMFAGQNKCLDIDLSQHIMSLIVSCYPWAMIGTYFIALEGIIYRFLETSMDEFQKMRSTLPSSDPFFSCLFRVKLSTCKTSRKTPSFRKSLRFILAASETGNPKLDFWRTITIIHWIRGYLIFRQTQIASENAEGITVAITVAKLIQKSGT